LETFETVAAAVGFVAPADAVTLFEVFSFWTHGFDDADAFVAENHVGGFLRERLVD
jgi:hypothetical protein